MTWYLTQAVVPYEVAAKHRHDGGFRDSYSWHKRVWEAFPGQPDADREFLTRIDPGEDGFRLLLLSAREPQRPGWCPLDCWQTKAIPPDFFSRGIYRFSLLANPTKKVRSNRDGAVLKNSRRVPIVRREELVPWMQRKAEQHGFAVDPDTLRTASRPRQLFVKKDHGLGILTATDFSGLLTVTDAAAFMEAATRGIGSAKAFGYGMLCLAPL
jgi:CRISPR system Cascade subunit CasE